MLMSDDQMNTAAVRKKTVLALGYFDSVHSGHRKVIAEARRIADERGARLAVFTFGGNLRATLSGEDERCVYVAEERAEILKRLGADEVYLAPTDFNFLSIGKLAFLNMMNRKYDIICYVTGKDYRFGKFAKGNCDDISRYASEKGQDYVIVDTVTSGDKKISTTLIKRLLSAGKVEEADLLLGEPYFITGKVFEDRKIGKELGFPTINVKINGDKHRLKDGVYAGHAAVDGTIYPAIINYGARPTFKLHDKLIEAHLIGFDGDLYGREMTVCFDRYLRDVMKFSSAEELKAQLEKDRERAAKGL